MDRRTQQQAQVDDASHGQAFLALAITIPICLCALVAITYIGARSLIGQALGGAGQAALEAGLRRLTIGSSLAAIFSAALTLAIGGLGMSRLRQSHEATSQRLQESSSLDELTGLPNRRAMVERLEAEIVRAKRTGSNFSCAIADIDRLTSINDEFGYKDGDAVLRQTAAVLKERLRSYDLVGRHSGEQFLLILPGGGSSEGLQACERLRAAVEKQVGDRVGMDYLKVTASFGVAAYEAGDEGSEAVLKRADAALARAKAGGKNRCMA